MLQIHRFKTCYEKHHLIIFSLLLVPLITFIGTAHASTQDASTQDELINQARDQLLWENAEWLNLLHYDLEFSTYVSQVDDDRFFYASDGKQNPEAELTETIKNLFIQTEDHNQQTQCRFIARTDWLSTKLNINKDQLPTVNCSDYNEWRQLIRADSVSLIFPAYHLNSPSSMFGHTLLRLDNSAGTQTDWLAYAVNFGADVKVDDDSITYAYQGVVGGYPGLFIIEPYFKKIQEYNRIEHRDIWEYKLNLTPEETERMITHLWEVKTINFDYYFFDENCSYRLLELLEVARPGIELTDEFVVTAIPVDTVRTIDDAGLIESHSYRPAQVTEIQFMLDEIPVAHHEIVLQLSNDTDTLNSEAFTRLSDSEQKTIVDIAYKYLRYQNTEKERKSDIAKRSYKLLQQLSHYPAEIKTITDITEPTPPESGHRSKRVGLAVGERLDNAYAELDFKMSFHDLEDNLEGFLQGAQINIGTIKLRVEDNVGLRLHQLDIVDIFSLTPRNDFFDPLSWKIYTGFERQFTLGKDQLVYHVTGGAGGTWEMIKNHQFYALAIARLEINKQLKNTLEPAIGFNSGFLSHFTHTTAHLQFSGEQFEDDVYRLRIQYIQNFVLSTNHSIKFSAKHQWQENNTEFSDISLNYQYYF
jgi:hypothetical protein